MVSRELVSRERKIDFQLKEDSFLAEKHNIVSSYDLVTILGNLIENAFEACISYEDIEPRVKVFLFEEEDKITIEVEDNGKKIDNNIKNNIFLEGVSSKGTGRGTGLYLVKSRIELYDGSIEIIEGKNKKIFKVIILKGD